MTGKLKDAIKVVMRWPASYKSIMRKHYDKFRHENSALTLNSLCKAGAYTTPKARGASASEASAWEDILVPTEDVVLLWLERAITDFEKRVGGTCVSSKQKVALLVLLVSCLLDDRLEHDDLRIDVSMFITCAASQDLPAQIWVAA